MAENKNKSSRFNKKNEIPIVIVSIALCFTVFFFSPADVFLGNQRDFVVSFGNIVFPLLFTAVIASGVFIAIQNLFLKISEKLGRGVTKFFFGLLLAMYVQMLFLNGRMTSFTGDAANYESNMPALISNLVLYVFIILMPFLINIPLHFLKKKESVKKLADSLSGKVIPYIGGLIFVMQLVGCGSTILTTDFSKYEKSYSYYLSYEQSMSLSKEDNIVVFLVDRLDSFWMDKTIEKYPDVKENFEGFTFYQNNVSHNTQTFPSVPQMLTAKMYKGEDWVEYISNAWAGDTVTKNLKEEGYDINLMIDTLTTYSSTSQLQYQCDNIGYCEGNNVRFNYLGYDGIIPSMTRISLSKLTPYAVKSYIIVGMGAGLSSGFVDYKEPLEDNVPLALSEDSDIKYFDYLKKYGLNADHESPTFTFLHLNGAHDYSEKLSSFYKETSEKDVTRFTTIRGDLEILFTYFEQMKKLGIYDNSTIIVLGDHGRAPQEIENTDQMNLESPIVASLLIKPKNAEAKPLMTDPDTELSNDYFAASILEYAGLDHEKFGYSYNDIINGDIHPDRYMQTCEFGGYGVTKYKTLYKITGNARDFDNWEPQEGHE